ncbi:hypothetical protein CJ030_MR3G026372 [Morella rubra]|uniref:Uncharacterized protein n=1 Tax=Morella rubra TaxID=262757 RepID=A0A6A1VZV0_9ROSI|nr:hypothetical protein CJ030_MR3G026372 [Morella rubra]
MVKDMDGPDKGVSPFTSHSLKASEIPRVSESDENDAIHPGMGSNIENPKKFIPKHYMSQTVSAAGKVTAPRKKILAERNEAPESIYYDTNGQKTSICESILTCVNPGTEISDISSPQGLESDDNEWTTLVDDGSLRPYDPLTNYLSPRPKFLRYTPNRRREIFLRRENEIRAGKHGLCISMGNSFESRKASDGESDSVCGRGSSASSQEGSAQQEDEEVEESDEEIEEPEEKGWKGWNTKMVLESLIGFGLLVFLTIYISSMNSPAPSPSLQALEGPKGGYCKIEKNHTLESFLAIGPESGSESRDQIEEIQRGWDRVRQRALIRGIEEKEMVEHPKMKVQIVQELNEVVYSEGGESEASEVVEDDSKGAVDESGEVVEPQAEDIEQGSDLVMVKTMDFSDCMAENYELQIDGSIEKFDAFRDYEAPSLVERVDFQILASDSANVLNEENGVWVEPVEEVYSEKAGDRGTVAGKMEGIDNVTIRACEVINSERMDNDDTGFEILHREEKGNFEEGITKHLEIESSVKAAIGSVFSMIVAFLVLGFHFKRKKTLGRGSSIIAKPCSGSLTVENGKTIGKDSSMILKSSSGSLSKGQTRTARNESLNPKFVVADQKHSSVLPNREEMDIQHAESLVSHSYSHQTEEPYQDYCRSRAPTIELLGEFVVGEVSSSLRSSGMKNRMLESEESNYSISTENRSGRKANSVPLQFQPAFLESSTIESHSSGRYTSEKKMVNKEVWLSSFPMLSIIYDSALPKLQMFK